MNVNVIHNCLSIRFVFFICKQQCDDHTADFKTGEFGTHFNTNPSGNAKGQTDSKGEANDPNSVCIDLTVILK